MKDKRKKNKNSTEFLSKIDLFKEKIANQAYLDKAINKIAFNLSLDLGKNKSSS